MRSLLYEHYYRDGLVHEVHERLIRSRRVVRLLFGVKIAEKSDCQADLFDLTTINLARILRGRVRRDSPTRICEIGVGAYAILSRALASDVCVTIDAGDIDADMVEAAKREVASDGSDVDVVHSDLFEAFRDRTYNLIFWNMPYQEDPALYLPRLFREAPAHLSPGGRLVIGYNTFTLSRDAVLEELGRSRLKQDELHTSTWNLHETLVLRVQ
jgi:SAM-dependent methyltransferase